MSEHRFDGSVSMSGDLRTERILFPKSAPGNPDSHSIGFPFTTTNPSDNQVFTDLTVEAQGGFGGSVNYTGGTLRLLCGRGKNASMHGNVYIGSTADRMANAPSPLTVNGDISKENKFLYKFDISIKLNDLIKLKKSLTEYDHYMTLNHIFKNTNLVKI